VGEGKAAFCEASKVYGGWWMYTQIDHRIDWMPESLLRSVQVLRKAPPPGSQLPQEEVRPHQPAEAQEEAQVDCSCITHAGFL